MEFVRDYLGWAVWTIRALNIIKVALFMYSECFIIYIYIAILVKNLSEHMQDMV